MKRVKRKCKGTGQAAIVKANRVDPFKLPVCPVCGRRFSHWYGSEKQPPLPMHLIDVWEERDQ